MGPLAPYFTNDAIADDDVQFRSLRQFGVALVVGLALFGAAGLVGVGAPQAARVEAGLDRAIVQPQAPDRPVEPSNDDHSRRS